MKNSEGILGKILLRPSTAQKLNSEHNRPGRCALLCMKTRHKLYLSLEIPWVILGYVRAITYYN